MNREQYVATDKATGVEVAVTGEFPPHPDDRMRIARTTTLFTRLVSNILSKDETERRMGFRAVETQLELADAMIRQDMEDVRRLVRETMEAMGVTQEQLDDLARQLRDFGGLDPETAEQLGRALGLDDSGSDGGPGAAPPGDADDAPPGEAPPEDASPTDDAAPGTSGPDDVIDLPPPGSYAGPDADQDREPEADEDDEGEPAAPA